MVLAAKPFATAMAIAQEYAARGIAATACATALAAKTPRTVPSIAGAPMVSVATAAATSANITIAPAVKTAELAPEAMAIAAARNKTSCRLLPRHRIQSFPQIFQ
jgi:hypothetical protein